MYSLSMSHSKGAYEVNNRLIQSWKQHFSRINKSDIISCIYYYRALANFAMNSDLEEADRNTCYTSLVAGLSERELQVSLEVCSV